MTTTTAAVRATETAASRNAPISSSTSAKRRATRLVWLAAFGVLTLGVGAGTASADRSSVRPGPFSWFVPAPPPASWKYLTLPAGTGVLWYPPALHPVHSDAGSVSAGELDRNGNDLAYLNATPKQGDERLSTWPAFRLARLREEQGPSVYEDAHATGLSFRGGKGSCVIDHYVTRVKHHQFREIACFVTSHAGRGSVVLAAAPPSEWARVGPQLQRAVAAYDVKPGG